MGLFVGAFLREPESVLPSRIREGTRGGMRATLEPALSRHTADRATCVQISGFTLVHTHGSDEASGRDLATIDSAVFAGATWTSDQAHVAIAGDPLLPTDAANPFSENAAQRLGLAQDLHFDALLAHARGQFCVARFDAAAQRLCLSTDRLGIHPLYYGEHQGVVYFGTALRMLLAACPALGEIADLTGQVQRAALGFTLGARTPYERIQVVEPGQVVEFHGRVTTTRTYASWRIAPSDQISDDDAALTHLSRELHARFVEAVQMRAGHAPAVAYLSGGLDSRCVAAALQPTQRPTHTINFAPAGSADLVLGAMAAQALGTQHFEYTTGATCFWERSVDAVRHWQATNPTIKPSADYTPTIATGFGGEGLLAPTNITAQILTLLRSGAVDKAFETYLRQFCHGIPRRLLRARWRDRLPALLRTSMRAELARCAATDAGQQFYLFLLQNELRGHVAHHFEDLDLRRIEWSLPFFDTEVVRTALRIPIDALMQHRFYYRWLETFGPAVSQVAWQAYPSSLPCPIAAPPGLRNQWAEGWFNRQQEHEQERELCRRVEDHLDNPRFPEALVDRRVVWLACLLTRLGLRRYAYYLRATDTFAQQTAGAYR